MEIPSLSPAVIDVWTWSLDVSEGETAALTLLLSEDERRRAARFHQPVDRRRWEVARGRLRQILGAVTAVDPGALSFAIEGQGRPVLAGPGHGMVSFNLSHSAGMAALAVSRELAVGVDIEALRSMPADEMEAALSPEEWSRLSALPDAERGEGFFQLWTLKEAFVKLLGTGISTPLSSFDIRTMKDEQPRLVRWDGNPRAVDGFQFSSARPLAGYVGAVAARTQGRSARIFWHPEADTLRLVNNGR